MAEQRWSDGAGAYWHFEDLGEGHVGGFPGAVPWRGHPRPRLEVAVRAALARRDLPALIAARREAFRNRFAPDELFSRASTAAPAAALAIAPRALKKIVHEAGSANSNSRVG